MKDRNSDAGRASNGFRLGLTLGALGLLALPFDLPLTQAALALDLPKTIAKLIRLSEAWSHGYGAAAILISVFVLDRAARSEMPRLVAGTILGGLLANLTKLAVARARPRAFDLDGNVLDSFLGFFPLGLGPSTQESFPSAHAATGFALCVVLSWRYPHGRWLFLAFAIVSGAQRLFAEAHYPSDVLIGGALGCLGARACLPGGLVAPPLDRWVERIRRRRSPRLAVSAQPEAGVGS